MAIEVTDAALAEVKRQREIQGMQEAVLRIGVNGGGCSGRGYSLGLDTDIAADDQTFEFQGLKVAIDARSFPFVDGRKLDFVSGPMGVGFKLEGGQEMAGGCGCGGGGCGCGGGHAHAEEEEEMASHQAGGCSDSCC